ncbi:MAG TPA: hypothetical protein VER17_13045 [Tepidisphaeraceae bacterium]|nr:hypothetical protein [Tepidisphaeraceae bacterium]
MSRQQRPSRAEMIAATCAALSALACIAVLLLWGSTYRTSIGSELNGPDDAQIQFASYEGRLMFGVFRNDTPPLRRWGRRPGTQLSDLQASGRWIAGDLLGWGVALPHLLVAALAAVPALWWGLVFRERNEQARRREEALCPACGYDIRATRDRCPECGEPVDATLLNWDVATAPATAAARAAAPNG